MSRAISSFSQTSRILVMNFGGIGNLVLMEPALRAMRARLPESRITLITGEPGVEGILANEGLVDDVLLLDMREGTRLREVLRVIGTARAMRFDCAFVASDTNAFKASLITRLMGIPVRIEENSKRRGWFYTVKVPVGPGTHETDGANKVVEAAGIEVLRARPVLKVTDDESRFVDNYLIGCGVDADTRVVGFHAGSGFKGLSKRWPGERFAELISRVSEDSAAAVVLTGGAGEVALNNEILACTGTSALNTAGELTIRHTAALISRCSLFVSNDSGLAHIAAAVRTPLIVLFGKTDVDRIAPRGENVNILRRGHAQATPDEALSRITVDDVHQSVLKILEGVR